MPDKIETDDSLIFLWPEQNQLLEVIISKTPSAASFAICRSSSGVRFCNG